MDLGLCVVSAPTLHIIINDVYNMSDIYALYVISGVNMSIYY